MEMGDSNPGRSADTNPGTMHPGYVWAAEWGIAPEAGMQAWEQMRRQLQADAATKTRGAATDAATDAARDAVAALFQRQTTGDSGWPLKKKESPWPKWDGKTGTFANFQSQLRVKIEEDRHLLGSDRAVCYGVLQTLPVARQARAHCWFNTGGPDGRYDWEEFLTELVSLFEDKLAKQTATKQLTRMRQGGQQFFTDFLQDFEYTLQQCGGSGWPDHAKLSYLNAGINTTLQTALITADLPEDNYAQWKKRVAVMAGRLESLPSYRPKGATHTKTWHVGGGSSSGKSHLIATDPVQGQRVDAEGDTQMGGINAIVAAVVNAMNGNATPSTFSKLDTPTSSLEICRGGPTTAGPKSLPSLRAEGAPE